MAIVDSCEFSLRRPDLLRARASAYRFDPHLHDTFSVVILTAGRVLLESPRWRGRVRAGDVFLFNPFEVHAGSSGRQIARYEVLYPSARLVADCLRLRVDRCDMPRLGTTILRRSAATRALLESVRAPDGADARVETALQRVLLACPPQVSTIPARGVAAVQVTCKAIQEMRMPTTDTDTLARRARLSKCHFIRIFRHVTGLAPQSYLRQVRLARARELVCAGVELVEVAHLTGFCDQPHMTREFKKVYGVTPGRLSGDLRIRRSETP